MTHFYRTAKQYYNFFAEHNTLNDWFHKQQMFDGKLEDLSDDEYSCAHNNKLYMPAMNILYSLLNKPFNYINKLEHNWFTIKYEIDERDPKQKYITLNISDFKAESPYDHIMEKDNEFDDFCDTMKAMYLDKSHKIYDNMTDEEMLRIHIILLDDVMDSYNLEKVIFNPKWFDNYKKKCNDEPFGDLKNNGILPVSILRKTVNEFYLHHKNDGTEFLEPYKKTILQLKFSKNKYKIVKK